VKEETKVYIDVGDVAELKSLTTKPNLVLGANMSLTEAMDTFNRISKENVRYKYTKALADHIDLIANVPVRNVSTSFCYAVHLLNVAVCLGVTPSSVQTFPNILEEYIYEPSVHFTQTACCLMPEYVNICTLCCGTAMSDIFDSLAGAILSCISIQISVQEILFSDII
jgi:hypothetical protein